MTEDTDDALTANLRALIGEHGMSIRAMAEVIGVPYRTLQNQLLGKARMPAATYLNAMKALGFQSFGSTPALNEEALAIALDECLGEHLPALRASGPGSISIAAPPSPDTRSPEQRLQDARRLAFFVAFSYYAAAAPEALSKQGPQ